MGFQPDYWHWIVLGMILMMLELALPSFTIFWFGLGGLLTGVILLLIDLSLTGQLLLWLLSSIGFTVLWFLLIKPRMADRTKAGISREAALGKTGMVTRLPNEDVRGQVRFIPPLLGNENWNFLSQDTLEVGDRVQVVDVSGNTLIVARKQAPAE